MRYELVLLLLYFSVAAATNFKFQGIGRLATAFLSNGKVMVSGKNDQCALGLGYTDTTTVISTPETVFATGIVDLGCGYNFCCVVKDDGTVWCWGQNDYGQLGDSGTTNACSPVQVTDALVTGIDGIRCASQYCHARKASDGSLVGWGRSVQFAIGTGVADAGAVLAPTAIAGSSGVSDQWKATVRGAMWKTTGGTIKYTANYYMSYVCMNFNNCETVCDGNTDLNVCDKIWANKQYQFYCNDPTNNNQLITWGQSSFNSLVMGSTSTADKTTSCTSDCFNTYQTFGPCQGSHTTSKSGDDVTAGTFENIVGGACTDYSCYHIDTNGAIWITGDHDKDAGDTAYSILTETCSGTDLCADGQTNEAAIKMDAWGTGNLKVNCFSRGCFVLKSDNTISAVGRNSEGQLGTGDITSTNTNPTTIKNSLYVIASAAPATCDENKFGDSGACTSCPTDSTRPAGDEASCTDCACSCASGFYGASTSCVACPANTAAKAGGDAHTSAGFCQCNEDFFGDDGACTECPTGHTNPSGDAHTCTNCGCACPVNNHVVEVATEPGPEFVSVTGLVDEQKLELNFNKEMTGTGYNSVVEGELVISGTYSKPGGETFANRKWDAGMVGNFNQVLSMHDTEAAAEAVCDNLCVGIDNVDISGYQYQTDVADGIHAGSAGLCADSTCSTSNYCGAEWYAGMVGPIYCDGDVVEAKTFSTELAGLTSAQIRQQVMFNGGTVYMYFKALADAGTAGCVEIETNGANYYPEMTFRFYSTNLCSDTDNGNRGLSAGQTSACGIETGCVMRWGGWADTVNKWRVIHSSVSTRVVEAGATAKTLGTAETITGNLPITNVLAEAPSTTKLVVWIGETGLPEVGDTLLDSKVTITSVAYTNSGNQYSLESTTGVAVASFNNNGATGNPSTECVTGTFPCYHCSACEALHNRPAGDRPADGVATACTPAGPATDCVLNQNVIDNVCTNCPAGKHNPNGAQINTHAQNGQGENICCDNGLHPVTDAGSTTCQPQTCDADYRVSAEGFCVPCVAGKRDAGDLTNGGETQCFPIPASQASDSTLAQAADIGEQIDTAQKVVDFNGDGKLDVIYYRTSNIGNSGANALVAYRNTGTNANPTYAHYYSLSTNDLGFTKIQELYVADLNNDGHLDILIVEVPVTSANGKSGKTRILQGKADGFENNQPGVTSTQQYPFTLYDKNGDGWLDICGAGGDYSQRCQINSQDAGDIDSADWGNNDGTHDVRGACSTGKYAGVALDRGITVGQLVGGTLCAGDTLHQLELFVDDTYITDISTAATRRRLRVKLGSSASASVTSAVWADFDGDGVLELALLTDDGNGNSELYIMSVTQSDSISYTVTNGVNHDTSIVPKLSEHATEAEAKEACENPTTAVGAEMLSKGTEHACMVREDKTAVCWGSGNKGELALADGYPGSRCTLSPPDNYGVGGTTANGGTTLVANIESISAGYDHSCAVIVGGTIKCWGGNQYGQLGDGTTTDNDTPVDVSGITNAIQVDAGKYLTCAVLQGGTVKCWGNNAYYAVCTDCWDQDPNSPNMGNPHLIRTTPQTPLGASPPSDVSMIRVGDGHVCTLHTDGAVKCWGYGPGFGETILQQTSAIIIFDGSTDAKSAIWMTAGGLNVCVVKHDKSVHCLGDNTQGSVGSGSTTASFNSQNVQDTGLTQASKVECAKDHCCALMETKEVKCWGLSGMVDDTEVKGHNMWGIGVAVGSNTPVTTAFANVRDIYVSGLDMCYKGNDKNIYCSGWDGNCRATMPSTYGVKPFDGVGDCLGVQLTGEGQWEAIQGPISYKAVSGAVLSCSVDSTDVWDKSEYLPKSCSDRTKRDDKFLCMCQFSSFTASGNPFDYLPDADLGAIEPASLDQLSAACIFDTEADVRDWDKLDLCFSEANNYYASLCAQTADCEAIHARWRGTDPDFTGAQYVSGRKQIGDKWVPIASMVKSNGGTNALSGGCSTSAAADNQVAQYLYLVETASNMPVFKLKVISTSVTGAGIEKVDNFDGNAGNQLIAADVAKTGTPQLLITGGDNSLDSTYSYSIQMGNVAQSGSGVKLATAVPGANTVNTGAISASTFTSTGLAGVTVRGVPGQNDVTISATRLKLPISCAVNERAVNGICEACPAGSTSSGVLSPADTPNTGCISSHCGANEHVKDGRCFACIAPETNEAGDDTTQGATECDCHDSWTDCIAGVQTYTGTCEGGADATCNHAGSTECKGSWTSCDANGDKTWINHIIPANGDLTGCERDTGVVSGCVCNGNKYAKDGLCEACPDGATANLVNYNPADGPTVCLCQGEMQSDGTVCSACPPGQTNSLVDYDPSSGVKECKTGSCNKDEHVVNHVCTPCPHNSQRLRGDDPAGPDTQCHCRVNSKVIGGDCIVCEAGSTNPKLCYASKEGGDTFCYCDSGYHASASNECTQCPTNSKNEPGDYAGDGETFCNCRPGFHVVSGSCTACPLHSDSGGGDELNGGDSYCKCDFNAYSDNGVCTACPANTYNDAPTMSNVAGTCKCDVNFKVESNACVVCELTSTRVAGSVVGGADTYCVCGVNEKVSSNLCVACEAGSTSTSKPDAAGADTECVCDDNYEKQAGVCTACPAGTESTGGDSTCVCQSNHYVETIGSCSACPTGSNADGGNAYDTLSTCLLEAGYFVDANGDVNQCPDGSTSSGGELINGGETKCKTEHDHYVDTNGDVQDCPANSAVPAGVIVEVKAEISGCICEKGFQKVGAACGQCPAGQTTDGTHRTNEAQRGCYCMEGYYVDDTDHSCKQCSVGGSTPEGGDPLGASTSCDCAADYRVNANAECEACSPGETNAPLDKTQNGETNCDVTRCAANKRVQSNFCVSCPAGMVNEQGDPANGLNTLCDYQGDAEDQYEFDVSGTQYMVEKGDSTNLGMNPTIELRISEGPFTLSRQPASTAGDDLVIASDVVWTVTDVEYDTYTQYQDLEASDDTAVIVWNPTAPGTYYYLSKDTKTMIGKIEVTLPLCNIPSSGTVTISNSCLMPNEITLDGDLIIQVASRRRLRKKLKSNQVIIQAAANSRHFTVPAGYTLTVNSLTLSDGNPGDAGGSILASGGSVVISNSIFKDNVGTTGGAIETEKDGANNEPSLTVVSSTFDNNEGSEGGAINAKAGVFNVDSSVFNNNKATAGSGGAIASATDIDIQLGVFTGNEASADGGAILMTGAGKKATLAGTEFRTNSASNGGALSVKDSEADLKRISVDSNTATADGGAILVDQSDVTVTSSNIRGNSGVNGGGIKTKNMAGKTLDSSSNTFMNNAASAGGGALHFEDEASSGIKVFESTFSGNTGDGGAADDMKSTGDAHIVVHVVDLLNEIIKAGFGVDCAGVDCAHRVNSAGLIKLDGTCRCACDGTSQYERNGVCTDVSVCAPGEVTIVDATHDADKICGPQSIADKQSNFDAAGAALSSLVTNKLKDAGLGDSDAFNLAVDMVGGVNKC